MSKPDHSFWSSMTAKPGRPGSTPQRSAPRCFTSSRMPAWAANEQKATTAAAMGRNAIRNFGIILSARRVGCAAELTNQSQTINADGQGQDDTNGHHGKRRQEGRKAAPSGNTPDPVGS